MMNLGGRIISLRALERRDVEQMYAWENDTSIWGVSGTTAPFSRHTLTRFIDEQQFDIYQTRQQRLVIETTDKQPVGLVDLFEFDPQNRRAGVGILIHSPADRGKGYASDALATLCEYARTTLGLHQLWANVGTDNPASIALFGKAGFTAVGTKREWQWTPDGFRDEVLMQRILG